MSNVHYCGNALDKTPRWHGYIKGHETETGQRLDWGPRLGLESEENRIGETERSNRDHRRGMQLRHWNKTTIEIGLAKAQETGTPRLGKETGPFTIVSSGP